LLERLRIRHRPVGQRVRSQTRHELLRNNFAGSNIKSFVCVCKNEESILTLSGRSGKLPRSADLVVLVQNSPESVVCDIFRSFNLISDHERIRIALAGSRLVSSPISCPNPITGRTM
jgi:hypothetical protein